VPAGLLQDNFTVSLPITGAPAPPGNVTPGPDGIPELNLSWTGLLAPTDFSLVALTNSPTTTLPPYSNWIRNGPSSGDLATFGPSGLQIGSAVYGGPALQPPLTGDMASVIGQPRVILLLGPATGSGATRKYPVLGFTGATVTAVGTPSAGVLNLLVQLCPVVDLCVTLGGGPSVGPGLLVYRGVSLSR
jgi:hypothetical protein